MLPVWGCVGVYWTDKGVLKIIELTREVRKYNIISPKGRFYAQNNFYSTASHASWKISDFSTKELIEYKKLLN